MEFQKSHPMLMVISGGKMGHVILPPFANPSSAMKLAVLHLQDYSSAGDCGNVTPGTACPTPPPLRAPLANMGNIIPVAGERATPYTTHSSQMAPPNPIAGKPQFKDGKSTPESPQGGDKVVHLRGG